MHILRLTRNRKHVTYFKAQRTNTMSLGFLGRATGNKPKEPLLMLASSSAVLDHPLNVSFFAECPTMKYFESQSMHLTHPRCPGETLKIFFQRSASLSVLILYASH